MRHSNHNDVKKLAKVLNQAHYEHLMSVHEAISVAKHSLTEAFAFLEAGDTVHAAASLSQACYDCEDLQKRILAIAEGNSNA